MKKRLHRIWVVQPGPPRWSQLIQLWGNQVNQGLQLFSSFFVNTLAVRTSLLWVLVCFCKSRRSQKLFSHKVHEKGFSPEWIFSWMIFSDKKWNVFGQCEKKKMILYHALTCEFSTFFCLWTVFHIKDTKKPFFHCEPLCASWHPYLFEKTCHILYRGNPFVQM